MHVNIKPNLVERAKRQFNSSWATLQKTTIRSGDVLIAMVVTNVATSIFVGYSW